MIRDAGMLVIVVTLGCGGSEHAPAVQAPGGCDSGAPAAAPHDCELLAGANISSQGPLVQTGISTDLALEGPGFFVVDPGTGSTSDALLTRGGRFTTDNEGFLVTTRSMRVLGLTALNPTLGPLQIGNVSMLPIATTTCAFEGNLDANAWLPVAAFNPRDPATYNAMTDLTVYDSLGSQHDLTILFVKTSEGGWDFHAFADGSTLTGGVAGMAADIADGSLTFDTLGRLTTQLVSSSNFNPLGATNPQPLNLSFGDPVSAGGTGTAGMTQVAATSSITFSNQDGARGGTMKEIEVGANGAIVAIFDNGDSRSIAQLQIGLVPAPALLRLAGDHLYSATNESGAPVLGSGCAGKRGCVRSGYYETLSPDPTECSIAP